MFIFLFLSFIENAFGWPTAKRGTSLKKGGLGGLSKTAADETQSKWWQVTTR
jgi:hypothetical protein